MRSLVASGFIRLPSEALCLQGRVQLARGSITSRSVISPRMRSCVTGSILIDNTLWSLRDDLANREAGRKSVFRSVFRENG